MSLKVQDVENSPSLFKVLVAGASAGVSVDVTHVAQGQNKSKPFLQEFPQGKLAAATTEEGNISGTNAVIRHVARSSGKLYGNTPFEGTQIDQWLDWSVTDIDLPGAAWLYPIKGYIANNPAATNKAKGDIRKALGALNDHLSARTFLVGERVTLADIGVALSLLDLYTTVLDAGFRKQFSHANRWFQTCVNHPAFADVVGPVTLCSKMAVAPKAAPKAEPKKQQQQQPKKQQPKAAAAPKKEAKPKNPLDALPKSKFDLEDWKRHYSNDETREDALPWLWENFDAEGYSFWFNDYLYQDELEKTYKAANLVGGWLQRAEPVRKYGFGSICILGEEPNLEVHGIWIFRGQDVPQEMQDTPDYETYKFWKADINDPKQKALIEDYMAWDGDLLGKPFNQGKMFK